MGVAAGIMTISLMSSDRVCWVCGSPNVELHHIYSGWANRCQSDRYGCTVFLCRRHHTGKDGVHFDRDLDLRLRRECQKAWETRYAKNPYGGHDEFRKVFGKSYL